ncbi:MAG: FmdB family zinc ribbon protein [Terriglobales bacterium]
MPIFEYVCKGCSHRFEAVVVGSSRPECPECQGRKLEQQFSVFSVGVARRPAAARAGAAPCGSCGDPRGPGSCSIN